jgi:chromatin remodeling complex protein RSC6
MVRKANPALLAPKSLSPELEAVVGKGPLPTGQVVKKIWEYIKKHDLQNPQNKRNILTDDKLRAIFGDKKEIRMFDIGGGIQPHMKK